MAELSRFIGNTLKIIRRHNESDLLFLPVLLAVLPLASQITAIKQMPRLHS
jgi:hypothetical protein